MVVGEWPPVPLATSQTFLQALLVLALDATFALASIMQNLLSMHYGSQEGFLCWVLPDGNVPYNRFVQLALDLEILMGATLF